MVTPTLDAAFKVPELHRVVNHPDLQVLFGDMPPPSLEQVKRTLATAGIAICIVRDDEKAAGIISMRWVNRYTVSLSGGFIRGWRGKFAFQAVKMFLETIFRAGVLKVVGEVVPQNRACLQMAYALGFRREGLNRGSIVYDGRLCDQVYVGLMRDEFRGSGIRLSG